MKKFPMTYALLFAAVFCVTLVFQSQTIQQHEALSLFLLTGDYFTQTFREAWPLSRIVASFISGFFRFPVAGGLLTALLITLVYLFANILFRFLGSLAKPSASVLACVAWYMFVHAGCDPLPVVKILFRLCIPVLLVAMFLPKDFLLFRKELSRGTLLLAFIAPVAVVSLATALGRTPRMNEKWATIEQAARRHDWDKILKTADVMSASKDREMIPFAMLALNAQGRMAENLNAYPVKGPEDLDMEGVRTRRGYYFSSILQECLGCNYEALHLISQSGCTLPYGTSMMVLRQTLKYNIALGDQRMIRKYIEVLKKSPANRAMAKAAEKAYLKKTATGTAPAAVSDSLAFNGNATVPVVTNNPIYNLILLASHGAESPMLVDRLNAYSAFGDTAN